MADFSCNKTIECNRIYLSVSNVCMGKGNKRYWLRLMVKTEGMVEEIFYKIQSNKEIDDLIDYIRLFYDVGKMYFDSEGNKFFMKRQHRKKTYETIQGNGSIVKFYKLQTYFHNAVATLTLYPYSFFPSSVKW